MRDLCSRFEAFTLRPVEFLAGLRIKHPRYCNRKTVRERQRDGEKGG